MILPNIQFIDARLAQIHMWLYAPDPSMNYQKALTQRQDDTGLWFLESNQYAKWKTDAASFLWLHGIPGCGKTILSSTILQNLLQDYDNDPGRVVVYFYFDFNDALKQKAELMLRSLICQLSQQCVKFPANLETLMASCDNGQRQPALHALEEVLQQIIQDFPHVYIVLDALDECSEREGLTTMLELLAAWHLQNLHILLTSRRERDIERSLETFIEQQNIVYLQNELVDKDIQKYVRKRLSHDRSLSKWQKDATVAHDIETALMNGAHGMYEYCLICA
jgi:Cdc6-like AAA superfamily ATPase